MKSAAISLLCRCCDEDDIQDIYNVVDESGLGVSWSKEKVLNEVSSGGKSQWYCIEPEEDDIIFGVFRLILDNNQEKGSQCIATVTDIFISEEVKANDQIHTFLIKYIINNLMRISFQLNAIMIHIEVYENESELIQSLEEEKFQETGGYLSEFRSLMKFKYTYQLQTTAVSNGNGSSLVPSSLDILPEPSSLLLMDDEVGDFGESLNMVLDLINNTEVVEEVVVVIIIAYFNRLTLKGKITWSDLLKIFL